MEMKIIEAALALVTIYLVVALLATQLSEYFAGVARSRNRNLVAMVKEAFNNESGLIKSFFEYGPIFSLSKGSKKPGAIPPDLFATSFLAVLNKGEPPRLAWRTPSEFISASNLPIHLTNVLRSQLGGAEADWNLYEARIARWFADIGDRAEGWYKKRNTLWMFVTALSLTFVLNLDSVYLFRTLVQDDDQRVALANVGQLISEEFGEKQGQAGGKLTGPSALTTASSDYARGQQAAAELDVALAGIQSALREDKRIAGFGYDFQNLRHSCAKISGGESESEKDKDREWFASNSDAWLVLLPAIQKTLAEARFSTSFENGRNNTEGASDGSVVQLDQDARANRFREVLVCTSEIAVWIKAAQGYSVTERGRSRLQDAGDALERSRKLVFDMIQQTAGQRRLRQQYVRNPEGFEQCVEEAGRSRAEFDGCLAASQLPLLPMGWPARPDHLCSLRIAPRDAVVRAENGWFCNDFVGNTDLDLPAFEVSFVPWKLASAAVGWLFTAVLVSLGAPFWFGVLGKIATLRTAGRVRGLGQGELPVEQKPPVPDAATAGRTGSPLDATSGLPPPFSDARNEFEHTLRPQDISRLQKSLGLPPSGQLDEPTRQAISARLKELGETGEQELTPMSYQLIVGRRAAGVVGDPSAASADGPWARGYQAPAVGELVAALNRIFPAPHWKPLEGTTLSDEVRARLVLYRVRTDAAGNYFDKQVVSQALDPGGPLKRLDTALRQAILADQKNIFSRETPPWLDDALGELGISEIPGQAQSDPRVVEYLQSLSVVPIVGDETPWCGAFVGWVMQRAGHLAAHAEPHSALLGAMKWEGFGQEVTNSPRVGDICIVNNGIQPHVAFWMGADATRVWLLGGNQGSKNPGGVTLVAFRLSHYRIVSIRRP